MSAASARIVAAITGQMPGIARSRRTSARPPTSSSRRATLSSLSLSSRSSCSSSDRSTSPRCAGSARLISPPPGRVGEARLHSGEPPRRRRARGCGSRSCAGRGVAPRAAGEAPQLTLRPGRAVGLRQPPHLEDAGEPRLDVPAVALSCGNRPGRTCDKASWDSLRRRPYPALGTAPLCHLVYIANPSRTLCRTPILRNPRHSPDT